MKLKQVTPTKVPVGDMEFYIRPFPAFKAANITGELASVLTPLLGMLVPLISESGEKEENEEKTILDTDAAKAAEAMANCPAIDGNRMEKLMKKLLLGGHIAVELEDENGNTEEEELTQDLADEIFCGNIQDMFVLCFHVIRLNFRGFFGKLPILSGKVKFPREVRKVM